jgi:hypothetical protein
MLQAPRATMKKDLKCESSNEKAVVKLNDEPKQLQPKQVQPKQDQPKQDDPKQDDPKQDDPKKINRHVDYYKFISIHQLSIKFLMAK